MTEAKRKEKINELMNKISLSLKDANLQQGFEIICNRISELEKENEELKEKLNVRSCQNCKHNNKSCSNDGSCVHYSKWEDYKNLQLIQAKEIIKKLVHEFYYLCELHNFATDYECLAEAEKLLNSEIKNDI